MWICWLIGHRFVEQGKIFGGLLNSTPYCNRCGRYAGGKIKPNTDDKVDEEEAQE